MASSHLNKIQPKLTRSAFWDVDLAKMDFDRYSDFTIIRVFERGTMDDIHEILAYYGIPAVVHSLTRA